MLEAGEQSCLALEARHPLGIARHLRGQHLDRDVAAELGVARTIDLAHPAFAEGAEDLVMAESLADQLERSRVIRA